MKLGAVGVNDPRHPRFPVERTVSGLCVPFYHQRTRVKRYGKGMSLKIASIGFVGTNPESTPLPGVDYSKNQEVYEGKRHKASIAVEPKRERKN